MFLFKHQDRGSFHVLEKSYEIFLEQKDFYGFLVEFSWKQENLSQMCARYLGMIRGAFHSRKVSYTLAKILWSSRKSIENLCRCFCPERVSYAFWNELNGPRNEISLGQSQFDLHQFMENCSLKAELCAFEIIQKK